MKPKKVNRWLVTSIMLCAIGMLLMAGNLVLGAHKAEIIIRFHYNTYHLVSQAAFWSSLLLMFMGGAYLGYTATRTLIKSRKKLAKKPLKQKPDNAKVLDTPEKIYTYLEQMLEEITPSNKYDQVYSTHCIVSIIEQLDKMNHLQTRLDTLLDANDMSSLSQAKDLMQEIENTICLRNVRSLINYYIVGGADAMHWQFEKTESENSALLKQAEGILKDVAEFINGGKSLTDIEFSIASFRKTIQNFIKEEQANESQFEKDFGLSVSASDADNGSSSLQLGR